MPYFIIFLEFEWDGFIVVETTGPITFADYMHTCLSHPQLGYYMNPAHHVIGSKGDFITSPEISQVFGELLAVWLLSQWLTSGMSREVRLVELGPGRGTLMHDVLRVFSQFPQARNAVKDVHLVETSRAMRTKQESKLTNITQKNGWRLHWHDELIEIKPDANKFTLLVAHEFFDALPFRLFQKSERDWREVLIDVGPDPSEPVILRPGDNTSKPTLDFSPLTQQPRLRQVVSHPLLEASVLCNSSTRFPKLPIGSRIEVSPASFSVARRIGELLHVNGLNSAWDSTAGSALIVDYGDDKVYGNSFRAFRNHKLADVFHRPGECDLTVNVDFAYLREATEDLVSSHGPITQSAFLERMGIKQRVAALAASTQDDKRRNDIENAAKRLVDPTGMGTQYKVMALTGKPLGRMDDAERWPFLDLDPPAASSAAAAAASQPRGGGASAATVRL
ncbi:DUF185-domain-containing protein [Epithele typhae]|uniref:DUF185-domain-containing protein n=1 Tax=Epithele typhae TaxID=378194 RepID=UPI00200761B7|nr:DUF185-domain-containing protein [Epithele typhae]KAH9945038.1 DUF185-domain-containing protein [Epithele typhae]